MKQLNNKEHNKLVLGDLSALKPITLKSANQVSRESNKGPRAVDLVLICFIVPCIFLSILLMGL